MKPQKVLHRTARRDGRPVETWKVRYEESVLDPTTGAPLRLESGTIKKRSRSETYPTKAAADARCREIENQRAASGVVTGREARMEPFGTFAAAFLDSVTGNVKARTLTEYRRLYECYVAPDFAVRAIGSVTPADARRFRAALVQKGLAHKTIKHAWDTFRRILDLAAMDGAINSNPAASVPLPRRNSIGDGQPFAPHPLAAEQVAAVAAHIAARFPMYGLVVLFAAYSGLRASELAGLEVGDLSLGPSPSVRVTRTKRKVRGGWEVGTPKSRKSRRTVPLDSWLADDLRAHLQQHPRRSDLTAPLFPARFGRNTPGVPRSALSATAKHPAPADSYNWASPIDPGTFYANYFKPALTAVGLPASAPGHPGVRWHDLRHTFAVLSLSAGAHYMSVSKWLGHESYVTTLNIYADYIAEDEGGKAAPLARPVAPTAATAAGNVIPLRRRTAG